MSKSKTARESYVISLTTEAGVVDHDLVVGPGDVFRAELEAGRHQVPADKRAAGFAHLMVQLWCAAVRAKVYASPFQQFIEHDLYDFRPGDDAPEPVDPTGPESDSGSPSATTSLEPPTGSTPTVTNG